MKLVVVESNFQVLLVPNYRVFRITVIYVKLLATESSYDTVHDVTLLLAT